MMTRAYRRTPLLLAYGLARAYCEECGHDFLIAFSCKGRGICPSCNTRRMPETAAYLADHVIPPVPVRQRTLRLFQQGRQLGPSGSNQRSG